MNEFVSLFDPYMSSRQVTTLYLELYDETKNNSKAKHDLYNTHMKAWRRSKKEGNERLNLALTEGCIIYID